MAKRNKLRLLEMDVRTESVMNLLEAMADCPMCCAAGIEFNNGEDNTFGVKRGWFACAGGIDARGKTMRIAVVKLARKIIAATKAHRPISTRIGG